VIRVEPSLEPDDFDGLVRQPGLKFLSTVPEDQKINWRRREYWRKSIGALHERYGGICAYTCHYVPLDTGGNTVEHFIPRSLRRELAYEWNNFRFVCGLMNGRKSNHQDVVDPFLVLENMFELDFPSLQIRPGPNLRGKIQTLAKSTITRLGLNKERNIRARTKYVTDLRDRRVSAAYVASHAPFISSEIDRLGIRDALKAIMPAE
jgi:hypothetical protein